MTQNKLLRLKRWFLDHKVAPRPQKQPELAKKRQQESPKYRIPLWQGTRQMLHRQLTILFTLNDPKKVIKPQEVIPRSQIGSQTTKAAWIGQQTPTIAPENTMFRSDTGPDICFIRNQPLFFHRTSVLLWQGTRQLSYGQSTPLFSINDPY